VTGLFRDLRGIAAATNSRRTYCLVFDWLYPQHFSTIIACLEAFSDREEVRRGRLPGRCL
jgi:exportin-7